MTKTVSWSKVAWSLTELSKHKLNNTIIENSNEDTPKKKMNPFVYFVTPKIGMHRSEKKLTPKLPEQSPIKLQIPATRYYKSVM